MTGGMSCLEHCSIRASGDLLGSAIKPAFKEVRMIFVGVDWAEDHHDVCLLDKQGVGLGKRRVPEGMEGSRQLQVLIAEHAQDPEQVVIGIESARCSPPATSSMRSTRWRSTAIGIVTPPPEPSRTLATPSCSPIWSAPIATTTVRWPVTPSRLRRSR